MQNTIVKFEFTAQDIIEEGRVTIETIREIKARLYDENVPLLSDEQIVRYLLACDNDIETTKKTIEAYYIISSNWSDIFNNRKLDRSEIQKALNSGTMFVSPKRTEDGCVIVYYGFNGTSFLQWDMKLCVKILFMMLEIPTHCHPPNGFIMITDMSQFSFSYLARLRPSMISLFSEYLQNALPLKLKRTYVFNTVPFIEKVIKIVKPFMNPRIFELIDFLPRDLHMEEFYKTALPKNCLPKELGGDLPSIHTLHDQNVQNLIDLEQYYDAEERQRRNMYHWRE